MSKKRRTREEAVKKPKWQSLDSFTWSQATTAKPSECAKNTDRELWRRDGHDPLDPDNFYQPSIHVTESGGIGINVHGMVIVRSPEEWHRLALEEEKPCEREGEKR